MYCIQLQKISDCFVLYRYIFVLVDISLQEMLIERGGEADLGKKHKKEFVYREASFKN